MPQSRFSDEGFKNEVSVYEHGEGDLPGSSDGKASAYNVGDLGSVPGSERSPGEGNGNLLEYCCLEISTDRGAWQATVHEVAKSWTRLKRLSMQQSIEKKI